MVLLIYFDCKVRSFSPIKSQILCDFPLVVAPYSKIITSAKSMTYDTYLLSTFSVLPFSTAICQFLLALWELLSYIIMD